MVKTQECYNVAVPITSSSAIKKFFQHGFLNVVGGAVASFLSFLFNYIVVQKTTVADYGEYTSAMAYVTLFGVPLSILSLVIIKKISSQNPHKRLTYTRQLNAKLYALTRRSLPVIFLTALLCWGWLQTQANFVSFSTPILILVLLLLTAGYQWLSALLTGWQWFADIALAGIVAMGLRFLAGWGLLTLDHSLTMLYLCLVLVNLIQLGVYFWRLYVKLPLPWWTDKSSVSLQTAGRKQQDLFLSLSSIIITTGVINLDVVLIKMLTSADFAGQYSLYSLFAKILLYASQPLINVAFTFFNNRQQQAIGRQIFVLSIGMIALFGVGMTALYALLPRLLILLVGKSQYLDLAPVLWWAAVFGAVYSLLMLTVQFLLARNRRLLYLGLLAPLLQVLLIYFFHQTPVQVMLVNVGVCTAMLLTYAVGMFVHAQKTL